MIQVLNYPPENSILLDGNKTSITLNSTNANGYFRAKIYVNDELFDEQGWSRVDDFTANKDLIYLYHSYFKPYFLGVFESGLLEVSNLIKKISIVITEYNINNDAVLGTVTLPDFYLIYNVKSAVFNQSEKLILLGLNAERANMKREGVITIPFYSNCEDEDVKVTVYDDSNNVLDTKTIANVSGKKIHIYTLQLTPGMVTSQVYYLRAKIEVGETFMEKIYNIYRLPNYEVNEVVFQNNFGFYIPAYFDGDFENAIGLQPQTYEKFDTSTAVYAVDENATFTINTGGLTVLEKDIVKEIATSVDCYFKNGSTYLPVNTATKKALITKSRLNNFADDLVFTCKTGLPFANFNQEEDISNFELILNSISNTGIAGIFSFAFEANFPLFEVFIRYRINETFDWSAPLKFSTAVSPQTPPLILHLLEFQVELFTNYNGKIIRSNILTKST